MDLLTVQEVATSLRVSTMTVRRYIASGKLDAIKVGRNIRVERSALRDMVEPVTQRQGSAAEAVEPGVLTFDDPLWQIVGMIQDGGPTDMAENHDRYLAEAYADNHDR